MPIPEHAKKVFEGKTYSVWQWDQELYDGNTGIFEAISRVDASMVIPVLPNGNILLQKDEQPHRKPLLSLPGGRLDPGEGPKDGARREFEEETGYTVENLEYYFSQQLSSQLNWKLHFYVGKDLEKVGEPEQSPGERITLYEYSFEDFIKLGRNPKFRNIEVRLRLLEAEIDPKKKQEIHDLLYA